MTETIAKASGENLIAGRPVARGEATFTAFAPRTGESRGPATHEATADEIAAAADAAGSAFPTLRSWNGQRRAELLRAIASRLESISELLVQTADEETALGASPRLEGELARTTGQLESFARWVSEGRHLEPIIDTTGPDVRRSHVPVGPVAVFGASNFPLAFGVPGGDTASALAAGCPVVAKGHPSHPATSELAARAILAACADVDAPEGTFSLVQGAGHDVGGNLVLAPPIKAVGFTGSLAGGQALSDLARTRDEPIPVFAEMGSLNPLFVLAGAAADRGQEIGEGFAASMTLGRGQFCTKPGVLVLPHDQSEAVTQAVAGALDDAAVGPMLNARMADAYRDDLSALAALPGLEVVRDATPEAEAGPMVCQPALLSVDVETFLREDVLQQEHFGPVCVVVRCPVDRFTDVATRLPGSLTATVHADARDHEAAAELQALLADRAGRVLYNGYPTGVAVVPAMHHGGPYPATTEAGHTSVGATAMRRFLRPVAFQDAPDALLPVELQDVNPLGLPRLVDWRWTTEAVERPDR